MGTALSVSDEVQELAWALIDEQATEEQVRRLEELLLENKDAREVYVMCMQMHADLHYLLGGHKFQLPAEIQKAVERSKAAKSKAPLPVFEFPTVPASPATFEVY